MGWVLKLDNRIRFCFVVANLDMKGPFKKIISFYALYFQYLVSSTNATLPGAEPC